MSLLALWKEKKEKVCRLCSIIANLLATIIDASRRIYQTSSNSPLNSSCFIGCSVISAVLHHACEDGSPTFSERTMFHFSPAHALSFMTSTPRNIEHSLIQRGLCLYCKVYRLGAQIHVGGNATPASIRSPIDVPKMIQTKQKGSRNLATRYQILEL